MSEHTSTESHDIPTSQLTTDAGTGGDLLVQFMREQQIEVAFGVISIHNLPLVEAVDRDLRFVPVRHEAAAVNAADGYARATGRIGVAITSTGTGAGNAAGAMLEALTAQSRVLHVTGNIESTYIGEDRGIYHEVPRQFDMLDAVSAHTLRVESAKQAQATLGQARRLLTTPPHGPVSVDWPIDLQYTADPTKQKTLRGREPSAAEPGRRELAKAVKVMAAAARPLIWVGGGARGVGDALADLAQEWGAGILCGANGRGSVAEDHPNYLGNFAAEEALDDLITDADCLLTVGSHLRAHETRNFELPLPETHVQIDVDAEALGRNFPVTVGVCADADVTVPALLEKLRDSQRTAPDQQWLERIRTGRVAVRQAHRGELGAYAQICDALRDRLPREAPIVRDVTIPGASWGNRLLEVYSPRENLYAAGGGIGQGLAMAIGAAVARPDVPTLAIIGDGGLAVHLGELCTLAQEQAGVIVALFSDGGYGVLRNLQDAKDSPRRAVDLGNPDFAKLAASLGLPHTAVDSVASFDEALAAAVQRGGPGIIEIDVDALRPRPDPMVPPVSVP